MLPMAQTPEVTADGWVTTDLRAFRLLVDHVPPRPWGYWDQIRADFHEPKIIWLWLRGIVFIVVGAGVAAVAVVTKQWLLLICLLLLVRGIRLITIWFRLADSTIQRIRFHRTATGVINEFEPHPILPTIMEVARATRPTGEVADVGAVIPLARAITQAGVPAEVWFLDDPSWQYQGVFAGRPKGPLGAGSEPIAAPDRGSPIV
jgi:hypothetical protein